MQIQTKRVYESASRDDGYRVLVDRIWPRGVSKDEAALDRWAKELAPSTELRRWFDHDPEKWGAFKKRYFDELREHKTALHDLLDEAGESGDVLTLVFAAKDVEHCNAAALREYFLQLD